MKAKQSKRKGKVDFHVKLLMLFIGCFVVKKFNVRNIDGSAFWELSFIIKSNKFIFFFSMIRIFQLIFFGPRTIFWPQFWKFLPKSNRIFYEKRLSSLWINVKFQEISPSVPEATCSYLDKQKIVARSFLSDPTGHTSLCKK